MLSKSRRQILHGYSVVRACLDDTSDHAVPVGVVAWDTPNRWQMWRWLEEDEKVRGIDPATRRLMRITRNQIQRWAYARKVPYEPALGRGRIRLALHEDKRRLREQTGPHHRGICVFARRSER